MNIRSHHDAARHIYNEFYLGQVRMATFKVVHRLRIADLLKEGPMTIEELAAATNTHETSLHRIMVTAHQMGLFQMYTDNKTFSLTMISDLMTIDHPMSMHGLIEFTCEEYMEKSLDLIHTTVSTGVPSFTKATPSGEDFYQYLRNDSEKGSTFDSAMTCMDTTVSPLLAQVCDFVDVKSIVDLGGGSGNSVLHILSQNENVTSGTVADMTVVIEDSKTEKRRKARTRRFGDAVCNKINYTPCDLFKKDEWKGLPTADAYMLKNILHDWSDNECDDLLSNVVRKMEGDATKRLLVVEKIVIQEDVQPHKAGHDIVKLIFFKEESTHRSFENFEKIFQRNGLKLTNITPLGDTDYYVFEGRLGTNCQNEAALSCFSMANRLLNVGSPLPGAESVDL
ncbi:hypothetical protein AKO1_006194 [Acrasis kona]|uniref:O-methyltransferase domain-containing protein n=1 Tax=Acrasis kona TaxID=1008807 RepID=A0AAW2YHF4_9EUKA